MSDDRKPVWENPETRYPVPSIGAGDLPILILTPEAFRSMAEYVMSSQRFMGEVKNVVDGHGTPLRAFIYDKIVLAEMARQEVPA